jgi:hypothetical protein
MSSAFVKENEYRKLNEVAPSLDALLLYLRQDNDGVRIVETKSYYSVKWHCQIYEMSDGLDYALDNENHWRIILD